MMVQRDWSDSGFNWRRELLLITMAGMEVSWVAGWVVIFLGAARTAGLMTAWLSTFVLYLVAAITARTLMRRRSRHSDWIIGGLVLASALIYINLNLYPSVFPFNPRWLGAMIRNITSGLQAWPRELTALFITFFIWFRGMRLPARHVGIQTISRQLQLGLAAVVVLAVASIEFPIQISGVVATYFVFALLSLALTRIEETARAEGGAASPFGRKWLMTLFASLLTIGVISFVASQVFTVDLGRALLRPLEVVAIVIVSAIAFLFSVLAQYLLLPLLVRLIGPLPRDLLPEATPAPNGAERSGGAARILLSAEFLNALRIVGLFLLTLIVLFLVVRSFRRWRMVHETAGGIRGTVTPTGSLADDLMGYLRDQWQRLRELADIRRLFQLRGVGTIRAIYANMLTLMAAADRPRRAGQTPYEFEPTVEDALPADEADISAITDAYVRARYGEKDVSEEELRRLKEAWRRVRADGEKLVEQIMVEKTSN